MPSLIQRLEERLVAAAGTPQPGDYNYLADVLEIIQQDLGGPDDEPLTNVPSYLGGAAAHFRDKGRSPTPRPRCPACRSTEYWGDGDWDNETGEQIRAYMRCHTCGHSGPIE